MLTPFNDSSFFNQQIPLIGSDIAAVEHIIAGYRCLSLVNTITILRE